MEDDRTIGAGKIQSGVAKFFTLATAVITGVFLIFLGYAFWTDCLKKEVPAVASEPPVKGTWSSSPDSEPTMVPEPIETKAQYIKSTRMITVTRGKGIYFKDFLKNPDKYKGERIRASVKIVSIEEKDGNTVMNVALTTDYEMAVVAYKGSVDVYKGDIVTIYGEGVGTIEGKNGMGADMTWPGILAKYVKKIRTDDGE